MTRESDAQLLAYIKELSLEDAKEYFEGRRIVDQWGEDRGTVTEVLQFSRTRMDYNTSEGGSIDYCNAVRVLDGTFYCCSGGHGRIVLNDSGCYKCVHDCKMREPCIFMEEK